MFARDLYVVEGGEEITERQENGIGEMLDALLPHSLVYVVRWPSGGSQDVARAQAVQQALMECLPEPCDISLIALDATTTAAILSPRSEQALDPLFVYALLEMFRRALTPLLNKANRVAIELPAILPLAPVACVDTLKQHLSSLNELLETIVQKQLHVHFQPIVHFAAGRIYGYEALIRVPQEGALRRPGMYFHAANQARLVSWLNVACQEKCFERASKGGIKDYLFLNMDAEGLAHLHQADRSLADCARESGIAPDRVVLEITERQAVDDFPRLNQYIEQLRTQGFRIAIDDAGAGYSSLHAIAEMRPDFVKIDRSLVRNIESNGTRRALLTTLTRYSQQIGAAVIAEGCETRDELMTILDIGVPYGQGYLLGRPAEGFKGMRSEMVTFVAERLSQRENRSGGAACTVESIALKGTTLSPDTPLEDAARKFTRNPDLESIVVVLEDQIEGLLTREDYEAMRQLEAQPGAEESPFTTLADCMNRSPLIVEADTSLKEVAEQVGYRRGAAFKEDILVAKTGRYVGVVTVRSLLHALAEL